MKLSIRFRDIDNDEVQSADVDVPLPERAFEQFSSDNDDHVSILTDACRDAMERPEAVLLRAARKDLPMLPFLVVDDPGAQSLQPDGEETFPGGKPELDVPTIAEIENMSEAVLPSVCSVFDVTHTSDADASDLRDALIAKLHPGATFDRQVNDDAPEVEQDMPTVPELHGMTKVQLQQVVRDHDLAELLPDGASSFTKDQLLTALVDLVEQPDGGTDDSNIADTDGTEDGTDGGGSDGRPDDAAGAGDSERG